MYHMEHNEYARICQDPWIQDDTLIQYLQRQHPLVADKIEHNILGCYYVSQNGNENQKRGSKDELCQLNRVESILENVLAPAFQNIAAWPNLQILQM